MEAKVNITIEMAFGDPDALDKAQKRMERHDFCEKENLHCPWYDRCLNEPGYICPLVYSYKRENKENTQ